MLLVDRKLTFYFKYYGFFFQFIARTIFHKIPPSSYIIFDEKLKTNLRPSKINIFLPLLLSANSILRSVVTVKRNNTY